MRLREDKDPVSRSVSKPVRRKCAQVTSASDVRRCLTALSSGHGRIKEQLRSRLQRHCPVAVFLSRKALRS